MPNSNSIHFLAHLVNLITELSMPDLPLIVNKTEGMCNDRRTTAYSINENTILTAVSTDVFRNGFPKDFSILAVIRSSRTMREVLPLFSIYSQISDRVLSLMVGPDIQLYYQDTDGTPVRNNIVSFGIGFTDQKYSINVQRFNDLLTKTYHLDGIVSA